MLVYYANTTCSRVKERLCPVNGSPPRALPNRYAQYRPEFRTQGVRDLTCVPIKLSGFPKESRFVGIHGTEDAGQRLIRGGVEPSHPRGAALRKAARSRYVWSKSVKRQVRKGGMDAAARHGKYFIPPQPFPLRPSPRKPFSAELISGARSGDPGGSLQSGRSLPGDGRETGQPGEASLPSLRHSA